LPILRFSFSNMDINRDVISLLFFSLQASTLASSDK